MHHLKCIVDDNMIHQRRAAGELEDFIASYVTSRLDNVKVGALKVLTYTNDGPHVGCVFWSDQDDAYVLKGEHVGLHAVAGLLGLPSCAPFERHSSRVRAMMQI